MLHNPVVKIALAVAISAASISAVSAQKLKVSSFLPPNHTFHKMLKLWSDEMSEKSNGEMSLEVFTSGQLGPPPRQFELVAAGAADLSIILHGATPGRFPMTELAGLPLSHPSAGDLSAITSRRLTELAPEYLAEEHAGTKIMWMAVTPPLKIHSAKADLSKLENIKGQRIRYAGAIWQQVVEKLEAVPLRIPPAQSADSISKGVADAASFPFEATKAFDMAPIIKYSLEPGIASATFAVVMNENTYNSLSPEMKKIIDDTTGPDRGEAFGKMWDDGEAEARQYMADGGVSIVQLSDADRATLESVVAPISDSFIGAVNESGKPGSEFVAAYTK